MSKMRKDIFRVLASRSRMMYIFPGGPTYWLASTVAGRLRSSIAQNVRLPIVHHLMEILK